MNKRGFLKACTVFALLVSALLLLAPGEAKAWGGQCKGMCVECCQCVTWDHEYMCCCSASYDGFCDCTDYYTPKKEWCVTGGSCQATGGRY
ncbi:MAG: hypothetical protein HYX75_05555 [Acidobacteria bacterium]|nr:hypothetical protein [Acidobacteriota bacterium]